MQIKHPIHCDAIHNLDCDALMPVDILAILGKGWGQDFMWYFINITSLFTFICIYVFNLENGICCLFDLFRSVLFFGNSNHLLVSQPYIWKFISRELGKYVFIFKWEG